MAGLFGQKIRDFAQSQKGADYFGALSRGENFGAAMDTANKLARQRILEEQALKRQQGIDAMDMKYKQAQIDAAGRTKPIDKWVDVKNPNTGAMGQMNLNTGKFNPYATTNMQPKAPPVWNENVGGGAVQQYTIQGGVKTPVGEPTETDEAKAARIARQELEAKRTEEMPQARFNMDNVFAEQSDIVDLIDGMLDNKAGLNNAVGSFDDVRPTWTMTTEGKNFRADRRRLESERTLEALKRLKATGATLGAVNAQEFATLQNAITNLSLITDEDEYKEELKRVRADIVRLVRAQQELYNTKFGGIEGYRGAAGDIGMRSIPDYMPVEQRQQMPRANSQFGYNGMRR